MNDWTVTVEQLAIVQAIKSSFVVYPLINATHVLAVGALVTCVLLMDLRLLGRLSAVPQDAFVGVLRPVALAGFVAAAATGGLMFAIRASEYAAMPLYWAKMGLIGLAGLNFIAFAILDRHRPRDAPLSRVTPVLAVLSMLLWPVILVAGRFLGYL